MSDYLAAILLDAAEKQDRALGSTRIAQLKESFLFFQQAGLTDDDIKVVMAITVHEMRLIHSV